MTILAEAVWEAVAPLLPTFSVEILPEVDSTNTGTDAPARAGRRWNPSAGGRTPNRWPGPHLGRRLDQ